MCCFTLAGSKACVVVVVVSSCRISPTEWAEPDTEEHSFTLLHSFWYITGALTLQGTTHSNTHTHTHTHTHTLSLYTLCTTIFIKALNIEQLRCAKKLSKDVLNRSTLYILNSQLVVSLYPLGYIQI